jgi:hypothetical protein
MQHDKYAIINNRTIFFGSMTAEWCDETAPTLKQAMSLSVVDKWLQKVVQSKSN